MNIVDVLRLDIGDIEKEFAQIASVLGNLGLSNYEARAYVALILRTHATAEEVAELAMINFMVVLVMMSLMAVSVLIG